MESSINNRLKMIIPSIIGVLFFLVPLKLGDNTELIVGFLGNWIKSVLGDNLITIILVIVVIDGIISLVHKIHPIPFIKKTDNLNDIFSPSNFWLISRMMGALFVILTYYKIGPELLWSEDTGGNMLYSILPSCIMWYVIGGFFLSLLTDYGLMDILSSLFTKISKPLFMVPGRAMIDCVTSWMGSSICGTYLTISQYEDGLYSAKEASIIICNFSLLSVSFCSLIANMLDFGDIFGSFYLTVAIASLLCAIIIPRIPPISRMPNQYDSVNGKRINEDIPEGYTPIKWGYKQALKRANSAPGIVGFIKSGFDNVLSLVITTLPNMMAIGTVALVIGNYTNIFDYLGIPIGLYLKLFNIPNAIEAGSVMFAGFADQFIPVIVGSSMVDVSTKFVLGTISIIQIIYLSDIGTLILTSRVPLNIGKLFLVFIERLVISVPVVVFCMHLFGIA